MPSMGMADAFLWCDGSIGVTESGRMEKRAGKAGNVDADDSRGGEPRRPLAHAKKSHASLARCVERG